MSATPPQDDRSGSGWRRPALLALVAIGLSLLRTDGLVGVDAQMRAAEARWLWAGVPSTHGLSDNLINLMLIEGSGGRPHAWFGLGQQLLYVPLDVVYHNAMPHVPVLANEQLRAMVFSLTLFPLVCAAACCALYTLLVSVGHSPRAAFWSSLVVLAGSAFHHHTLEGFEVGEEVTYLALGFASLVSYLKRPSWGAVVGMVVGAIMPVLLRLPHVSYAMGMVALGVLVGSWPGQANRGRLRCAIRLLAAGVIAAIAIDRAHHFVRFGEWTTTYIMKAETQLIRAAGNESLPTGFLFSGSAIEGFAAQLVGLNKGVVFYSPLLWVGALWWVHRRFASGSRVVARAMGDATPPPSPREATLWAVALVFLVETAFYAPYVFTFDTGWWGNRFTEAPIVVLTAMFVAAWLDVPARAAWWQRALFVLIVVWAIVTARVGSFEWF